MTHAIFLNQKVKQQLSTSVGPFWKTLGRFLEIKEIDLDIIDHENVKILEKACAMFTKWERINPSPNIETLKTALQKMERLDLVRELDKLTKISNLYEMDTRSPVRKDVSDKYAALKSFYLKNYQKVAELRPPLKVAFSVDILGEFVELCLVDAGDVQMDAVHRVELMEFLKKQKNYKTIQYNKVFMEEKSLLLISGIAGIGKSWLLKKCLLDWANNQIWKKVDFVFYFECRILNYYENISNIKELLDFFYKDFVSDLDICNHNILFVIDGLDEFKYLDDLINYKSSSQYPIVNTLAEIQNFKSVVAGRVYAIDRYQNVDRMPTVNNEKLTIQVMGFNENGISYYIENNVVEEKQNFVKTIFKDTPIAKAMASVPFYLSRMCKIIVESKERDFSFLTMTDLYASIFLHFLKNHITKNKIPIYKIMESEYNKKYVLSICKIAYELFVENKVIFSKKEIQMIISEFDKVEDKLFGFIERIETDYSYCYQFAHLTLMEFCASVYAYNTFSGEEIVRNGKLKSCLSMICGLTNKNENSLLKCLVNLNDSLKEKISIDNICNLPHEIDNKLFIECFYESQSSFDEIKSFDDERKWRISIGDGKTSYETSCENYFVNHLINQFIKSGRKLTLLTVDKNILSDEEKNLIKTCSTNVRNVHFYRPINIEGWKPKENIQKLLINISRYLISKKEFKTFLPWINVCDVLYLYLHRDINYRRLELHRDTDYIEDIIEWIRCSNIKKLLIEYRGEVFDNLDKFKNYITRKDV